jgi:hypothetical protein
MGAGLAVGLAVCGGTALGVRHAALDLSNPVFYFLTFFIPWVLLVCVPVTLVALVPTVRVPVPAWGDIMGRVPKIAFRWRLSAVLPVLGVIILGLALFAIYRSGLIDRVRLWRGRTVTAGQVCVASEEYYRMVSKLEGSQVERYPQVILPGRGCRSLTPGEPVEVETGLPQVLVLTHYGNHENLSYSPMKAKIRKGRVVLTLRYAPRKGISKTRTMATIESLRSDIAIVRFPNEGRYSVYVGGTLAGSVAVRQRDRG